MTIGGQTVHEKVKRLARIDSSGRFKDIWQTIRQIPRGKVATYGEIARLCGLIGGARVVGHALHALPENSGVPWHRVINSQGRISLRRTNGAYSKQKRLLEKEGVIFIGDRTDLGKFGWLQSFERDRK